MKFLKLIILSAILSSLIFTINFVYLREDPSLFPSINIVALFTFLSPIIALKYAKHRKVKELEEMFAIFLRDFVESVRGGMTIPQAFKSVSENDYRKLSPYVKKMCAQMDWGIPVEKVLLKFSKESKSKLIGRIISSVIESHRLGGNLADCFEALSKTSIEVERLRAERRLFLHSQMITGYIVFFVFLAIIIGLERFFIPGLAEAPVIGGEEVKRKIMAEYRDIFRNLILIQGLFAGLAVGKMAEGAMVAGLKHSLFMMFVGLISFILIG